MCEIKNKQLIEGFSNNKVSTLAKKANKSFGIIDKPLKISLKVLKQIEDKLKKGKPNFVKGKPQKVIDTKTRMLLNLSLSRILILRKKVLPACIRVIYFSKQIKKLGPLIIQKELKNGNKKVTRNYVLASKLKFNTIKKALRDKKFAKIRVKKITRKKPKKEKTERIKKEKFTLNHHQLRRSQEALESKKLSKVKYDFEPLQITALIGVIYLIFNYVYFKL